jgi:heme-degrading monooxygenase HmoA
MQARVTTIQLQPGMIDKTIAVFGDFVIPAAKQQPGFKGGMLLTDRDAGRVIAISLWDTEEELMASENSGYYQAQMDKLAGVGFVAGPPAKESYNVSLQV